MKKMIIEPGLHAAAIVHPAGQCVKPVSWIQCACVQRTLQIPNEKLVAKISERLVADKAEVARRNRAAGHTGNEIHIIEKRGAGRIARRMNP